LVKNACIYTGRPNDLWIYGEEKEMNSFDTNVYIEGCKKKINTKEKLTHYHLKYAHTLNLLFTTKRKEMEDFIKTTYTYGYKEQNLLFHLI